MLLELFFTSYGSSYADGGLVPLSLSALFRTSVRPSIRSRLPFCLPPGPRFRCFGFMQGTDEEELERVMEVSGMRDADVWAPLTGEGDPNLYDSEEEEMGGASVFFVGGHEEQSRVVGRSANFSSAAPGGGGGGEGGGGRLGGKRALGGGGSGGGSVAVHNAKISVL